MIDYIKATQEYFDLLLSLQLFNTIISLLLSMITAYISFRVFMIGDPTYEALKHGQEQSKIILKQEESLKQEERKVSCSFLINYCMLTSILATCMSSLQFKNNPNLITSILFSIIGPFSIRDRLLNVFGTNILSDQKKNIDDINKKGEEEYFSFMKNLMDTTKKENENEQDMQ